jgi:hypothetical protein
MNAMSSPASDWNIYRTRFLIKAKQLDAPLVFTDPLGREHSGNRGDYLVESSDGLQRIAPREIFEDIYVPMGPAGDSWPSPSAQHASRENHFPHELPDPVLDRVHVQDDLQPPQQVHQPYHLHQQQQIYEPLQTHAASASSRQPQLNPRPSAVSRTFVA